MGCLNGAALSRRDEVQGATVSDCDIVALNILNIYRFNIVSSESVSEDEEFEENIIDDDDDEDLNVKDSNLRIFQ